MIRMLSFVALVFLAACASEPPAPVRVDPAPTQAPFAQQEHEKVSQVYCPTQSCRNNSANIAEGAEARNDITNEQGVGRTTERFTIVKVIDDVPQVSAPPDELARAEARLRELLLQERFSRRRW